MTKYLNFKVDTVQLGQVDSVLEGQHNKGRLGNRIENTVGRKKYSVVGSESGTHGLGLPPFRL